MAVGTYFPGRGTIVEQSYLKGKKEGLEKGLEKARAQDILHLLERRGIPTTEALRTRVTDCPDLDTLDRWFDRAITATDAEDLFTDV